MFGAGERDDVSRIALALARERGDPARLADASRRLVDEYIVRLHQLGGGALRVADKLPDNVVLVGLIRDCSRARASCIAAAIRATFRCPASFSCSAKGRSTFL